MKYVFFLSLLYKKFKKPCSFRVFIDDVMVDEVVLDKDINLIKDFEKKYVNESNRSVFNRNWCRWPMAEKIWIFHINLQDSNKNIFLDFNVNDSDYTNGFMSRSALVKITRAGLIKESIFNRSKDFFIDYMKKTKKKFFHIKKHRLANNVPIDDPINDAWKLPSYTFRFPSVNVFLTKFKNNNSSEEKEMVDHWCGGSFLVKLNLIKKHKNIILQDGLAPVKGVVYFDPFVVWLKQLQDL